MFLSTQWNFKGGFWGNGKQNLAILGGVPSSSTRFSSLRLVLDHGTRLFFKVFGIRFRGSSCEPLSKREFIKIRVEFYLLCVMCPVYLTVNSHRKYCNYFRKHKICPGKNSQKVTCYQPYLHCIFFFSNLYFISPTCTAWSLLNLTWSHHIIDIAD